MSTGSNIVWHAATVTRERREKQNGHRSGVIWFTGLSGSGKSTLAHSVEEKLHQSGRATFVLDGDNVRHGLCSDLGFSREDRTESLRRIGEMAKLFMEAGVLVLTAFISPFRADRGRIRQLVGEENFFEVYCRCPLEVCEQRDVKGLYKKARQGTVEEFTGISSPYEEPVAPDLFIDTANTTLEDSVRMVLSIQRLRGILPR